MHHRAMGRAILGHLHVQPAVRQGRHGHCQQREDQCQGNEFETQCHGLKDRLRGHLCGRCD